MPIARAASRGGEDCESSHVANFCGATVAATICSIVLMFEIG
jgi:hypothetical protein